MWKRKERANPEIAVGLSPGPQGVGASGALLLFVQPTQVPRERQGGEDGEAESEHVSRWQRKKKKYKEWEVW